MFICTELIEETGRPPGVIFGMWGYFWPGSDKFEFWKKFHTIIQYPVLSNLTRDTRFIYALYKYN